MSDSTHTDPAEAWRRLWADPASERPPTTAVPGRLRRTDLGSVAAGAAALALLVVGGAVAQDMLVRMVTVGTAIPLLLVALERHGDSLGPDLGMDGSSFADRRRELLETRHWVWVGLAFLFILGAMAIPFSARLSHVLTDGSASVPRSAALALFAAGVASFWRARRAAHRARALAPRDGSRREQ